MHEQQQWSRRNGKCGWRRRQLWRRWRRQWRRKRRGQHWSRKMMAKDEGWGSEWSGYKRNLLLDQKASVLFTRCVKFSNKTTWYIVLHVLFVSWDCLWFYLSWASVFSLEIFFVITLEFWPLPLFGVTDVDWFQKEAPAFYWLICYSCSWAAGKSI